MAAPMPPVTVPSPAPGPVRYGLFTAARGPLDLPEHAIAGGLQFEVDFCADPEFNVGTCPATGAGNINPNDFPDDGAAAHTVTADPFYAYAGFTCSPVGYSIDTFRRRATAKLMQSEQTAVEGQLWEQMQPHAQVITPATFSFAGRIGRLEWEFYQRYGYQGTIHMVSQAAESAARSHMLIQDGPLKRTPLGSVWSFGAGYSGDFGGMVPAEGFGYAIITPPVTVWRSPDIFVPDPAQTFNHVTNQMSVLALREYAMAWDCDVVFAIQVPLDEESATAPVDTFTSGQVTDAYGEGV